jgi:UDP-GlcNAc3NAcA epimerase
MSDVEEIIVHTGQHFDKNMSDVFFDEMRIPRPDYNLAIASLSHGAMTGRMLEAIETIILDERPDWVLVYGDTNSTLAGALAASKLRVKVAHVEAGLRSFNMNMPEEHNRILTDWLDQLEVSNNYALATIHRAENTDNLDRLHEIVRSLNEIHKITPVILPLHPRTKKKLEKLNVKLNVHVVEPVGYLEMVFLLKNCRVVLSDSGGVQKEAYFFKKSCLILREETEWIELVECGANHMVGANYQRIMETFDSLRTGISFDSAFYGEGDAAEKIVKWLKTGA